MLRHAIVLSMLAPAMFPISATALDLEITGTFNMDFVAGTLGADLQGTLGNDNSWSLSMQNVEFLCDSGDCFPTSTKRQHILADSFSFQFSGPDAAVLNAEVGQHFTQGGINPHSSFLYVDTGSCYGIHDVYFYIWPANPADGVYMQVNAYATIGAFSLDPDGCPTIDSFQLSANQVVLFDRRGSNDGNLADFDNGTIAIEAPVSADDSSWGRIKAIYR